MDHGEFKALLCDAGHEDAVVFDGPSFDDALVGFTHDGRAVYDYGKMVECLVRDEGMEPDDAADFIGYNTLRSLPYAGPMAPVVMYGFDIEEWR